MQQPSLSFLNYSGDITITWDPTQNDKIKALVEKKLAEGYSFFIAKPTFFNMFERKVALKDPAELAKAKNLVVPTAAAADFIKALDDKDVADSLMDGSAQLLKIEGSSPATGVISKDPDEIITHKATAIRLVVGG